MGRRIIPFPVSFSRMQMIECPLALWKRMHNVPPTTPEPSFFTLGKECHECYDFINKNAVVINDELLNEALTRFVHGSNPVQVRNYLVKYVKAMPMDKIVYSELPMGLTYDLKPCDFDDPECAYRAIIDIVKYPDDDENDCDIHIVDNKTGWQMYAPDTVQLDMYTWMFNKHHPEAARIKRGIYFGRYGKFRWDRQTMHNYAALEQTFITMAHKTWDVAAQFPADGSPPAPCPGSLCGICNWAVGCPAAQTEIGRYTITSQEEAEELGRAYVAKKQEVSLLAKRLKDWSSSAGDIQISDVSVLTNQERTRRSVDALSVLQYLLDNPEILDIVSDFVTVKNDILDVLDNAPFIVDEVNYTQFALEKKGDKRKC